MAGVRKGRGRELGREKFPLQFPFPFQRLPRRLPPLQPSSTRFWKYEDSEESEVSSQGTDSSQEETENLEPWSRIFDEAEKRHETRLSALINVYEGN